MGIVQGMVVGFYKCSSGETRANLVDNMRYYLGRVNTNKLYNFRELRGLVKSYRMLESRLEEDTQNIANAFIETLNDILKHPLEMAREYGRQTKSFRESMMNQGRLVYVRGTLCERQKLQKHLELEIETAREKLILTNKILSNSFEYNRGGEADKLLVHYNENIQGTRDEIINHLNWLNRYKTKIDSKIVETELEVKPIGFWGRVFGKIPKIRISSFDFQTS